MIAKSFALKKMHSESDWMVKNHEEKPQTFDDFLVGGDNWKINQVFISCIWSKDLEDQDQRRELRDNLTKRLKQWIKIFFKGISIKKFDMKSKVQNMEQLSDAKIVTTRVREDTGLIQYNASQIFEYIEGIHKLKANQSAIILTDVDLYPRAGWSYVFGSTKVKSRICLISIARHDPEFPNIKLKPLDQKTIMYRAIKTATHEFCHALGIHHCKYYECLMNGSNKIDEADRKPFLLCPICTRKQRTYLRIEDNIIQHFEEVSNFMESKLSDMLLNEVEIYSKMIQDMRNFDSDDRYNTSLQLVNAPDLHNYTNDNDRTSFDAGEYTNRTINTEDNEKGQTQQHMRTQELNQQEQPQKRPQLTCMSRFCLLVRSFAKQK
eukprot:403361778